MNGDANDLSLLHWDLSNRLACRRDYRLRQRNDIVEFGDTLQLGDDGMKAQCFLHAKISESGRCQERCIP